MPSFEMKRTVSMKDVALAAGVSQPAVSYAYNKPSEISEAQREHILKVAKKLGYPGPNVRGGSLRSGRVGAIGLMISDELPYAFVDPSTTGLLRGIGEIGELANVALALFPLQKDLANHPAEPGSVSLAVRGFVDGLIIYNLPDDYPVIEMARKQNIPFVVVDAPIIEGTPFVGIDDFGSGVMQMEHLLELGHRKIGIIADRLRPDGLRGEVTRERFQQSTENVVRARLEGYLKAGHAAGVEFEDLVIIEAGGFDYAHGDWAAAQMLAHKGLTAVAATSDVMALSFLKIAAERQVAVPAQFSVIGFDDIPEAAGANLTTIRQPLIEKGRNAARVLTELLNNPPARKSAVPRVVLPTELVVRATTQAIQPRRKKRA
ncbi:LacI family DNA-binding transcriptional regulator [Paraburkholderia sp. D15]|uniref:LacI family DNA-binding transcriptional regulator n=1 Tax=Paraburkholderia sp. D15 TaxID=2880218 RepID=UPI00247A4D16|nr:LacI family DNA-binding transcriptional regulator [Paraburkholderia sp. D15]WGS53848.1 LacI family DNA-binding transcriptional regulator [Paraburkholderia sp. D15]